MLKHHFEIGESPQSDLAVLVHGRAGTMSVMSAFKRCVPPGAALFFPEAPRPDPIGGFSWWEVQQHADIGPELDQAVTELRNSIEEAIVRYGLQPSRIYALGFSQGGALLSALVQREPQRFTKLALLASFVVPLEAAGTVTAPSTEILIVHGSNDEVVPLTRAIESKHFLESRGFSVQMIDDPVGHKVGSRGMQYLKSWLADTAVSPRGEPSNA